RPSPARPRAAAAPSTRTTPSSLDGRTSMAWPFPSTASSRPTDDTPERCKRRRSSAAAPRVRPGYNGRERAMGFGASRCLLVSGLLGTAWGAVGCQKVDSSDVRTAGVYAEFIVYGY